MKDKARRNRLTKRIICLIAAAAAVLSAAVVFSTFGHAARNNVAVDRNIEHGRIDIYNSPNIEKNSVNDNTVIHMIAVPDEGYDLKEWNVRYSDGTPIEVYRDDPSAVSMQYHYSFKIPQRTSNYKKSFNIIISAVFDKGVAKEVSVSFEDLSKRGSSISIDRVDGTYLPGDTVTVTADIKKGTMMTADGNIANASYYIENGETVYLPDFPDYTEAGEQTWTFTMPDSDVKLICYFDTDPAQLRKISADNRNPDEGIVKTNVTEAVPGDTVEVTAEPGEEYECTGITVRDGNGDEVLLTNGTFVMPETDVTLSAVYVKKYISRRITYTDNSQTVDLFYSDDYFGRPSTEYNSHLATLSVFMAKYSMNVDGPGSADNTEWYEKQPQRVFNFFKAIGFENPDSNKDYRTRTGFDTMGIAAASRKVGDYTVIAVVPRSGGYFREWSNNVWLGDGTQSDYMHEGWYNAALKLTDYLSEYIETYKITGKIKLWMAGYSRGGAVTNIAAGLLDNKLGSGDPARLDNNNPEGMKNNPLSDNVTLTRADVYAYTFEAPQGANINSKTVKHPKNEIYCNIWNIVNPGDLITKLAMNEWGFTRFGSDRFITTEFFDPSGFWGARATFRALYGVNHNIADYKADSFTMYEIDGTKDTTKSKYDSNIVSIRFLENLVMAIGSRENYCANYQKLVSDLLLDVMDDAGEGSPMDRATEFAKSIISPTLNKIISDVSPFASDVEKQATAYGDTALPLARVGTYLITLVPNETYSLYANIGNVLQNHETDVSVCHLQSMDSYYIEAFNDSHTGIKISRVVLRDNADMGRVTFRGYNDLILTRPDGTTAVSVKGQTAGKSKVMLCETGYAFGYYSYIADESMELFFPIKSPHDLTVKSYSKEMNNKISYTIYCQYSSVGVKDSIKGKISGYSGTSWFSSDPDRVYLNVNP